MTRTLILFGLGAAILLPFETTLTLSTGIFLLLAAVVSGVFALADPARLSDSEE